MAISVFIWRQIPMKGLLRINGKRIKGGSENPGSNQPSNNEGEQQVTYCEIGPNGKPSLPVVKRQPRDDFVTQPFQNNKPNSPDNPRQ
jgi:hypothetical protein